MADSGPDPGRALGELDAQVAGRRARSPGARVWPPTATVRPSTGVMTTVLSAPSRSTTSVTGLPALVCDRVESGRVGEVTFLPSTETMRSPGWSPPAWAGVLAPLSTVEESSWTLTTEGVGRPMQGQRAEGEEEGDQEVHRRAGRRHDDALAEGLVAIGPRLVGRARSPRGWTSR